MGAALAGYRDSTGFPEALTTLTFGFLLLAAYLTGDILSWFKLPKITGYILAGILFGPHALSFLTEETVLDLKLIDDLALTFIALAAGGELRLNELRERRHTIVLTAFSLSMMVFAGVGFFTMAAGSSLLPFMEGRDAVHLIAAAAILGTFAIARSPSSAIAIITESRARGPFTEMVLGVTVVMDVLVIAFFAVVVSLCQAAILPGAVIDFFYILLIAAEITGSVLAGILLGAVISRYIAQVRAEIPIFLLAIAFLVTFFSREFAAFLGGAYGIHFHPEPMLICLTAGFWVQNRSPRGALLIEKIDRSSLPVFVIFFSLTGASLDIGVLRDTWLMALLLVIVRAAFIWAGAWLGGRIGGDPPRFRRMSGFGFLTQAGVSLGLAGIVLRRFPEWGAPLSAVIVATITINQLIGPVAFKMSLTRVGEAGAARSK